MNADMAVLSFWLFLAAVIGIRYWRGVKERELKLDALQLLLAMGEKIDRDQVEEVVRQGRRE